MENLEWILLEIPIKNLEAKKDQVARKNRDTKEKKDKKTTECQEVNQEATLTLTDLKICE